MIIQSPHFSTCSKAELLSRISPSFRSKRVPSAQDNYTQQSNTNLHKNSFRKHSSPSKASEKSKNSRSRSKRGNSTGVNRTVSNDGQGTGLAAEVNYLKD